MSKMRGTYDRSLSETDYLKKEDEILEMKNMKICIPTNGKNGIEETISEHFGRASTYTIVDLDTNEVNVVSNIVNHESGQCHPTEVAVKEGIKIVLCAGLGRGALNALTSQGIDVYIGASGTVKHAVESFKQGNLTKADRDTACAGHHGHHQGQNHCCH